MGPGLLAEIPVFDRNQGAVSLAEAELERAIRNYAAVTPDDVGVQARRVDASGGTGTGSSSDALQSDLRTTDNGSIVLRTTAGSIVLDNGSAPGQPGDDDHGTDFHKYDNEGDRCDVVTYGGKP